MKFLVWLTPLSFALGLFVLFAVSTTHKAAVASPAAIAAHQQPPSPDVGQVIAQALDAVEHGNWRMLAAALLVLLTFLVRWLGSGPIPWLKTDEGGTFLVLLLGIASSFAHTLAAPGVALGWSALWHGLQTGILAGGGYAAVKRLVWPLLLKLWQKIHPTAAPASK